MTTPLQAQGLEVTWTDYRGTVWDLTRGTQGVILDLDQAGLDWAGINQTFTTGGQILRATSLDWGTHHLAVLVGWDRKGADYLRLRSQWWTEANSPFWDRAGVLSVTAPGGQTRTRRLVLGSSPETVFKYDPSLGVDTPVEVWTLTGPNPWWYGLTQVVELTQSSFTSASSVPFYGNTGAGWPLNISSTATASNVFMSNDGQGPMWVTWTLQGPMSTPRVGTSAGVLTYTGNIAAGEVVEISTAPERRAVVERTSGMSRYGEVSGNYAPLPAGERSPLVVSAEGLTSASKITATATTAYATAF